MEQGIIFFFLMFLEKHRLLSNECCDHTAMTTRYI